MIYTFCGRGNPTAPTVFYYLLALTLLAPSIGWSADDVCLKHCQSQTDDVTSMCQEMPDVAACDGFDADSSTATCQRLLCDYAVPDKFFSNLAPQKRHLFATEYLLNEFGDNFEVLAEEPFYGPDNTVLGYLYIATKDEAFKAAPESWAKQSQRLLDEGTGAASGDFDQNFVYVVLGNRSFVPPHIGVGTGLPAIYHNLRAARGALVTRFGGTESAYTYLKSHLDPFYPIMEFSRSGRSYFYNLAKRATAASFALSHQPREQKSPRDYAIAGKWFALIER